MENEIIEYIKKLLNGSNGSYYRTGSNYINQLGGFNFSVDGNTITLHRTGKIEDQYKKEVGKTYPLF